MRAARTQFDTGEFPGAVATPTCCCSCCCATTFLTASVVGAGAAVVAGRRRGLPRSAILLGLLLGVIAPWLWLVPSLLPLTFPESDGGSEWRLLYSILLIWAAYQALAMMLRPRSPIVAGVVAILLLGAFVFVELTLMVQLTVRGGDFTLYLVGAALLSITASAVLLLVRGREGRTVVEMLAGVGPKRGDEAVGDA